MEAASKRLVSAFNLVRCLLLNVADLWTTVLHVSVKHIEALALPGTVEVKLQSRGLRRLGSWSAIFAVHVCVTVHMHSHTCVVLLAADLHRTSSEPQHGDEPHQLRMLELEGVARCCISGVSQLQERNQAPRGPTCRCCLHWGSRALHWHSRNPKICRCRSSRTATAAGTTG